MANDIIESLATIFLYKRKVEENKWVFRRLKKFYIKYARLKV